MGTFGAKYTPEQRDAFVGAVLDGVPGLEGRGPGGTLTAPQAVKAAADGKLPGLPAFEVNLSTVRHYAQLERRAREGVTISRLDRKDPREAVELLVKRMVRIADKELQRIERRPNNRPVPAEDLRKLARAVREIDGLARSLGQTPAGGDTPTPTGDQAPAAVDLIDELAAEARQPATPGAQRPEPPGEEGTREALASRPAEPHEEDSGDRVAGVPVEEETSGARSRGAELAAAQALLTGV
jgi:hypothetical protein